MRSWRAEQPPTAIFAGSDLQALGVIHAARRLGLDVPAICPSWGTTTYRSHA